MEISSKIKKGKLASHIPSSEKLIIFQPQSLMDFSDMSLLNASRKVVSLKIQK